MHGTLVPWAGALWPRSLPDSVMTESMIASFHMPQASFVRFTLTVRSTIRIALFDTCWGSEEEGVPEDPCSA